MASASDEVPLEDLLTLIVTTSPLPRHPCSRMLDAVIHSVHRHCGGETARCRLLIVADGYRVVAEGERSRWKRGRVSAAEAAGFEAHKQALRILCSKSCGGPPTRATTSSQASEGGSMITSMSGAISPSGAMSPSSCELYAHAELLEQRVHRGFSFGVKRALRAATTPYVLVVQHDRCMLRPAPLRAMLAAMMARRELAHVNFPTGRTLASTYSRSAMSRYQVDLAEESVTAGRLRFVPILQFYDSTHLSRRDAYLELYARFQFKMGDFTEDRIGQLNLREMLRATGGAGGAGGAGEGEGVGGSGGSSGVGGVGGVGGDSFNGIGVGVGGDGGDGGDGSETAMNGGFSNAHGSFGVWVLDDGNDEIMVGHLNGRDARGLEKLDKFDQLDLNRRVSRGLEKLAKLDKLKELKIDEGGGDGAEAVGGHTAEGGDAEAEGGQRGEPSPSSTLEGGLSLGCGGEKCCAQSCRVLWRLQQQPPWVVLRLRSVAVRRYDPEQSAANRPTTIQILGKRNAVKEPSAEAMRRARPRTSTMVRVGVRVAAEIAVWSDRITL